MKNFYLFMIRSYESLNTCPSKPRRRRKSVGLLKKIKWALCVISIFSVSLCSAQQVTLSQSLTPTTQAGMYQQAAQPAVQAKQGGMYGQAAQVQAPQQAASQMYQQATQVPQAQAAQMYEQAVQVPQAQAAQMYEQATQVPQAQAAEMYQKAQVPQAQATTQMYQQAAPTQQATQAMYQAAYAQQQQGMYQQAAQAQQVMYAQQKQPAQQVQQKQEEKPSVFTKLPVSIELPGLPKQASAEVSLLVRDAEKAISRLHHDTERKEDTIKNKTEEKLKTIQQTIEEKVFEMKHQAQKMTSSLRKKIKEEALKLKQEAAKKTLDIIHATQEKALYLQNKAQREALAKKYGLPLKEEKISHFKPERKGPRRRYERIIEKEITKPALKAAFEGVEKVPTEWKNDVSKKFYKNMTYIKNIILASETPQEKKDYLKRFAEQNLWFDKTLSSTRYMTDPGYKKIENKQKILSKIATTQKIADKFLKKLAVNAKLTPIQKKKVRLALLYDINGLIQERVSHPDPTKRVAPTPDEVKTMVNKHLSEISVMFKKRSDLLSDVQIVKSTTKTTGPVKKGEVIHLKAEKLEEELEETKEELQTKSKLLVEKDKLIKLTETKLEKEQKDKKLLLTTAKAKLQEKAKDQIEAEIALKEAQRSLVRAKENEAVALHRVRIDQGIKQDLSKKIEVSDKKVMDLEIDLTQTKHSLAAQGALYQKREADLSNKFNLQLEMVQRDAQQAKHDAIKQARLRRETEEKAKTIEKLSQQTIESITKYLDKEKIALRQTKDKLQRKEAELSLAKKKLQEGRSQLVKDKKLLEDVQNETKKIAENSRKINADLQVELLGLQRKAEKELRTIRDNTKKEIDLAKKQLLELKADRKKEIDTTLEKVQKLKKDATQRLKKIHVKTKAAMERKNLAKMKEQITKKKIKDKKKLIAKVKIKKEDEDEEDEDEDEKPKIKPKIKPLKLPKMPKMPKMKPLPKMKKMPMEKEEGEDEEDEDEDEDEEE